MAFSYSKDVNVGRCVFTDSHGNFNRIRTTNVQVGGDYIQTTNIKKYYLFTFGSKSINSPDLRLPLCPSNSSQSTPPPTKISSSSTPSNDGSSEPDTISYISNTANLVAKIIYLLDAGVDTSHKCRDLQNDLEITRQTLILTGVAVRVFKDLPIGRSLGNIVNGEVKKCCSTLQIIFDNIEYYHKNLHSTSLDCVWLLVWWNGWGEERLPWLREELSVLRVSLARFLMALNSIEWENIGNKMQAGDMPIKEFRTSLLQGPCSLKLVKFASIEVIDHLGRKILVPKVFCLGWDNFNFIINTLCANCIGNQYIEQGDYRVIRSEDNYNITPSEFAAVVGAGVLLEISIILHQQAAFKDNKEKCPRCNRVNSSCAATSGWIECYHCSGWFQVAEADELDKEHDGTVGGEDGGAFAPSWQSQ